MIKAVAVTAPLGVALAAPGNHRGPSPANQQVCDDIGAAGRAGELDDKTHAIDAYYSANRKGTAQQLLQACADAGAPQ